MLLKLTVLLCCTKIIFLIDLSAIWDENGTIHAKYYISFTKANDSSPWNVESFCINNCKTKTLECKGNETVSFDKIAISTANAPCGRYKLIQLKELSVTSVEIDGREPHFQHVSAVEFVSVGGISSLEQIKALPEGLRELVLFNITDMFVADLGVMPLSGIPVDWLNVEFNPQLSHLTCGGTHVNAKNLEIVSNSKLKHLNLKACHGMSLELLKITGNRIEFLDKSTIPNGQISTIPSIVIDTESALKVIESETFSSPSLKTVAVTNSYVEKLKGNSFATNGLFEAVALSFYKGAELDDSSLSTILTSKATTKRQLSIVVHPQSGHLWPEDVPVNGYKCFKSFDSDFCRDTLRGKSWSIEVKPKCSEFNNLIGCGARINFEDYTEADKPKLPRITDPVMSTSTHTMLPSPPSSVSPIPYETGSVPWWLTAIIYSSVVVAVIGIVSMMCTSYQAKPIPQG